VSFTVLLHPKAAQELGKIERQIRARIIERARELRVTPDKIGKPLKQSNFWSMRIGDYRAIYQIDENKQQVFILFIGHRSTVYDDFLKMF